MTRLISAATRVALLRTRLPSRVPISPAAAVPVFSSHETVFAFPKSLSAGPPEPSSLGVVDATASSLQTLLEFAGVSWGISIVGLTIAFRSSLLPLVVFQMRFAARFAPLLPEISGVYRKESEAGYPDGKLAAARKLRNVWVEAKLNPLFCFVTPLVQIPVFITASLAVRQLMTTTGSPAGDFLWLSDLTVPDPTYTLPILNAIFIFSNLQMISSDKFPLINKLVDGLQIGTMLALPAIASLPSGLVLYWATSTGFTLSQALILKVPAVREAALGEFFPQKMMEKQQRLMREAIEQEKIDIEKRIASLSPEQKEAVDLTMAAAQKQLQRVNEIVQKAIDPKATPDEAMRLKIEQIVQEETDQGRLNLKLKVDLVHPRGRTVPQILVRVDRPPPIITKQK